MNQHDFNAMKFMTLATPLDDLPPGTLLCRADAFVPGASQNAFVVFPPDMAGCAEREFYRRQAEVN